MTTREKIIRQISVNRAIPEDVTKAIIAHVFDKAMNAMKTCDSLEISGFGSFIFNKYRAKSQLEKYVSILEGYHGILNTEQLSERKTQSLLRRICTCEENIKWLTEKLKEHENR